MAAKKYPIKIRFVGEGLGERGVPIYELGEALTAIQRLIYRAYLEQEGRKIKSIHSIAIRRKLALQIESREKGSDVYNLVSFLQSPGGQFAAAVLAPLLVDIIKVGAKYVHKKVLKKKKGRSKKNEANAIRGKPTDAAPRRRRAEHIIDMEAVAFFNEFRELAGPINKIGGIEKIEIYAMGRKRPMVVDAEFLKYVNEINEYYYYDSSTEIEGVAERIHVYNRDLVELLVLRHKKVLVHMDSDLFDDLMNVFKRGRRPRLSFRGRPIRRANRMA